MPYKKILIALECTDEENNVINEALRLAGTYMQNCLLSMSTTPQPEKRT